MKQACQVHVFQSKFGLEKIYGLPSSSRLFSLVFCTIA